MSQRELIPLKERPLDLILLIFFYINAVFITYMFDIEQLVIADPNNFEYPWWPPKFMVDLVHWWGFTFDPALIARPPWFKATIWIDQLYFGPFYIAAIYAFHKGKEWIRIPGIIWASMLMTNVIIILSEEIWGEYASDHLGMVLSANGSWIVFPLIFIFRMRNTSHPFTREIN